MAKELSPTDKGTLRDALTQLSPERQRMLESIIQHCDEGVHISGIGAHVDTLNPFLIRLGIAVTNEYGMWRAASTARVR